MAKKRDKRRVREREREPDRYQDTVRTRRRGQWDSAAWTINLSDTPPTRQMWQALRCTAVSAASATVAAPASSFCQLRHEWQQLIFIRRRRSCSLCCLPLAGQGYRMWLPQLLPLHVARCKRANKLRIDLCDLWHSRKINLNKRSVLVSTLSSLSCSAHLPLPLPPGKCKFHMKIKEYKTEAATKVWREVACGMWQVASDAVRFASVLAMFAWRITWFPPTPTANRPPTLFHVCSPLSSF